MTVGLAGDPCFPEQPPSAGVGVFDGWVAGEPVETADTGDGSGEGPKEDLGEGVADIDGDAEGEAEGVADGESEGDWVGDTDSEGVGTAARAEGMVRPNETSGHRSARTAAALRAFVMTRTPPSRSAASAGSTEQRPAQGRRSKASQGRGGPPSPVLPMPAT